MPSRGAVGEPLDSVFQVLTCNRVVVLSEGLAIGFEQRIEVMRRGYLRNREVDIRALVIRNGPRLGEWCGAGLIGPDFGSDGFKLRFEPFCGNTWERLG